MITRAPWHISRRVCANTLSGRRHGPASGIRLECAALYQRLWQQERLAHRLTTGRRSGHTGYCHIHFICQFGLYTLFSVLQGESDRAALNLGCELSPGFSPNDAGRSVLRCGIFPCLSFSDTVIRGMFPESGSQGASLTPTFSTLPACISSKLHRGGGGGGLPIIRPFVRQPRGGGTRANFFRPTLYSGFSSRMRELTLCLPVYGFSVSWLESLTPAHPVHQR